MQSKTILLATALAILPASAASAQDAAVPAPGAVAAPPASAADSASALDTAPADAAAPAATAAPEGTAPTAAATQADLKAGATVYDSAGATVGTIESVTGTGAVIASGKLRAEVPAASFAKNAQGLVIGITKAEFEAAVNNAKS